MLVQGCLAYMTCGVLTRTEIILTLHWRTSIREITVTPLLCNYLARKGFPNEAKVNRQTGKVSGFSWLLVHDVKRTKFIDIFHAEFDQG